MVSCTGITRQSCSFEIFISVASEQDLQIAADLAALFSKAKRNIKVPINLVKIKDLQKIKKGGPGCVSFKNGEIIWGNPTRGEDYIKKNLKTVI